MLSAEQMELSFDRGLPVPVNRRAVRRFVARGLRMFGNESAKLGFQLREHLEDVALLEQLRQGCREQARELKRHARQQGNRLAGKALITYVCTSEGRRAQRLMERLSERIGDREPRLCA